MIFRETEYMPMMERDKQTWIQKLRSDNGAEQQRTATEELTRHLSAAALRCLRIRRDSTKQLDGWSDDEVVTYAGKVVDATMAELMSDDFREFELFDDDRRFTMQAAQLVVEHIAADLDRR